MFDSIALRTCFQSNKANGMNINSFLPPIIVHQHAPLEAAGFQGFELFFWFTTFPLSTLKFSKLWPLWNSPSSKNHSILTSKNLFLNNKMVLFVVIV